jgi:conjugative relaxase-like TrwC/TraI family protein
MAVESPRPVRNPSYYLQEQSLTTPVFIGNGARELGIEGQPVDRETFLNLHDGYTTRDGQRDQKLPKYMHKDRRGSFEMTFNLPKCGSILKEVAKDERIGDVMTDARAAAFREVEKQAYTRTPWEQPGKLVGTFFRHAGSRLDDPHAHDHLWIANLSKSSKGWKAIELGYLEMDKVSKVYRDSMVKGFRQLGYKVKQVGKDYEIVGVPAEVKAKFSRRHADIAERESEYERKKGAPLTSKAKSRLSVHGRPEKPTERPLEDRRAGWIQRLSDYQHDHLKHLVAAARSAVRKVRWRQEARSAFDRMRGHGMSRDDHSSMERNINDGRSR